MLGPLLTRWTIRLSLAAYAVWLAGSLSSGEKGKWPAFGRWLYAAACGLFLAHVACAFHFYHGWSHQAAFDDTARETEEVLGIRFGAGLYFNYLFIVVWLADAAWLWRSPSRRWSWPAMAIQLYLALIAFNGAVVFESGPTRWIAAAAALGLAALAIARLVTIARCCHRVALP